MGSNVMSPAVRTVGLSRHFGPVHALNSMALEVPQGIIFGFLGPNGSGKTTTIRLLLGLLEATSGTAEVLGYDTRTDATAIRERCGALLEHCGLYERLSAVDNLELYGRFWRLTRDARRARIRDRRRQRGQQTQLAIGRLEQNRAAVRTRVGLIKGRDHGPIGEVRKQDSLCYRRLSQRRRLSWEKARVVTALYHVEAFVFLLIHALS